MTRAWRAAVVAVVAALTAGTLAACGAAGDASPPPSPTGDSAAAALIDENFPDPDVVRTEDGWLAFATGSNGLNVQVARSADLATWTVERRDALPALPAWASTGRTWAPDVAQRADGTWVMYVTAQDTASGRQCIGVATSARADGTYAPASDAPLVCPVDDGGAIDPSTFTDDDGSRYLLWKTDGNCCGKDTWIEIARLRDDGLALVGTPTRLISQDQPWEGNLVEAPVLVRHDDEYALLYSANDYGGDAYATGVARSSALLGPYTKQPDPLLSTAIAGGDLRGPGGQDVVSTADGDVLVFHAWDELYTYRSMHSLPLRWGQDGSLSVVP
ncbi:glycoside hydrolase family 43 protein [Cellulomonas edaphi]|uniref:Glycoside hydrolase family 43 protein n=1 Tax=Cellulomonas edaphi TaxID=3053468 RepID=A0ABT7S7L2_9CELL|nr:glycoside hydrolase family 43 protein [Cellulomons edaphi]MDM7831620.1 glycoside hydrolase family 43 protein [Cellulomons edaphi]